MSPSVGRTMDDPPLATLEHRGVFLAFPWADLRVLEDLVRAVPPEAALDENYPRIVRGSWAASGSPFGIALKRVGAETLLFSADEWRSLGGIIHTYLSWVAGPPLP
ncbi:MAG: hypothetical protein ACE5OS_06785 [Anaerolineae bacterium]